MSNGIVNNIALSYPLVKFYILPYSSTVNFSTGFLFPNNKNLTKAIWSFGDSNNTTETQVSSSYSSLVSAANTVNDFFPGWTTSKLNDVEISIPKFEVEKIYNTPGSYTVNVTLVSDDGNSYTGLPITVNIPDVKNIYTIPTNWSNISQSYSYGSDLNFLLQSGTPQVTTVVSSISSLPIDVEFQISNLDRLDIDYIEWSFGDGTVDVTEVFGNIITQDISVNRYSYSLAPIRLKYEPQVTVYFNNKTKYKLQVPTIPLIDISNICLSVNDNKSINDTLQFNIEPVLSYDLPVEAKFTHLITKHLKYIIWDYNDGEIDIVPVTFSSSLSNITQTHTTTHKYNSVNYYGFFPACLYLYNDNGNCYVKRYSPSKLLQYNLGILDGTLQGRVDTGYDTYIHSTTNFQKYHQISTLVEYPQTNTGFATLHIRLSLDLPEEILYFEKIVWKIGNETIIQDKNTSQTFGKLTLENITTSTTFDKPISITAELYGIPAVFADVSGEDDLVYYDTYERDVHVVDKDIQEAFNLSTRENILLQPPAQPTLTITDTGVEIITPITDTVVEVVEETEPLYIGSDIIFNNLFKALNPVGNFLNRYQPTIASSPSNNLVTKRVIGFFRPSKTTPIIVDPGKFTFTLNLESIDYNKPYYFPDPYKYGSNTTVINYFSLSQSFKKNARYGLARNEPNQPQDSVSYYGYNTVKANNLPSIVDSGYIHDKKQDVYGNIYGLLKDGNTFRQNIVVEELNKTLYLLLNGYKFYDDIFGENIAFNYSLTGTYNTQTIRSGLSSYTNGFNYPSTNIYTLNFGDFKSITPFKNPTEVIDINTQYLNPISVAIRDCAFFTLNDTDRLTDPISSDVSSYPLLSSYYYSSLYEAGANTAVPYVRPLRETLSANFTQNVRVSANNGVIDVDGGMFETNFNVVDTFFNFSDIDYIDSVNPSSLTSYISSISSTSSNINTRDETLGSLFVKDIAGNTVNITTALSYLQSKYPSSAYQNLTAGILNFEMVYDTLFIQTNNYLIVDKVKFENGQFENPNTSNNIFEYNQSLYNPISNRYKLNNFVYFAVINVQGTPTTTSIFTYPTIYKIDTTTLKSYKVFPDTDISNYTNDFQIDTVSKLYTQIDTPKLTYNSDLNMFNVTYLIKDQNKMPYLFTINFKDKQNNIIDSTTGYEFNDSGYTFLFNPASNFTANFQIYIQRGGYTQTSDYLLI